MEIFIITSRTIHVTTFARNNAMIDDYIDGKTLNDIGKKYGVTSERVRQVIVRAKYLAWKNQQIDLESLRRENKW
jgi:Mor family transcriptional regulator